MALLFAVLGGLFLMHGLSSHGATHHAGAAGAAMAHAADAESSMQHALDLPSAATPGVRLALPSIDTPAPGGGHSLELAELCMAVLVGGLLVALAAQGRGRAVVVTTRRTFPAAAGSALTGRTPDPPDLLRLSVCRC